MRACLEERADIEVCAQTSNGLETVNAAMDLRPDLIILDVLMPGLNGIEVASILKKSRSAAKIILFTMFGDYIGNTVASTAGVNIVLPKPEGISALVEAINSLLDLSPRI
jgi:DNA-binding NarL/FixJ family response regulator